MKKRIVKWIAFLSLLFCVSCDYGYRYEYKIENNSFHTLQITIGPETEGYGKDTIFTINPKTKWDIVDDWGLGGKHYKPEDLRQYGEGRRFWLRRIKSLKSGETEISREVWSEDKWSYHAINYRGTYRLVLDNQSVETEE